MMKQIVNSIFNYETGFTNFFKKKLLKSKKCIIRINKIRAILQKWFSDEFEYNYSSPIYDEFSFYVFNNNELYIYSILFKDEELINIILLRKNIIVNPPYFIQIEYEDMDIILTILKHCSIEDKSILSKEYDIDKILYSYDTYDYENAINKSIQIYNNNITEIYYYSTKYKKGASKYKYIYNDNYIYSYQEIVNNYQSKFGRTYRSFLLFI